MILKLNISLLFNIWKDFWTIHWSNQKISSRSEKKTSNWNEKLGYNIKKRLGKYDEITQTSEEKITNLVISKTKDSSIVKAFVNFLFSRIFIKKSYFYDKGCKIFLTFFLHIFLKRLRKTEEKIQIKVVTVWEKMKKKDPGLSYVLSATISVKIDSRINTW